MNFERPTVVITGAGGFVAPYVIREFRAAGYRLILLDRNELDPQEGDEFIRVDLLDADKVGSIFTKISAEIHGVIHLAGYSHVGQSWDDITGVFQANVVATANVYGAASRFVAGDQRFLFVSSTEIYGAVSAEHLPVRETTRPNPYNPYGISKHTAEELLRKLSSHGGMPVYFARPVNHTGPGQSTRFALPAFAERVAAIERGSIQVMGHGNLESRRDFLDVRDVARAYLAIFRQGQPGVPYVVSSGVSWKMRDIVEKLFELSGVEPVMEADPKYFRTRDIHEFRGDSYLLYQHTGWEPKIPFEITLADVLADARNRQAV